MYNNRTRQCTKCEQSLPETPEYFGQVTAGRVRSRCRNCEKEKCRQYGLANNRKERDARRRELEKGFRVSEDEKAAMFRRQQGMCLLCARPLESASCGSVDHMLPLSRGGSNKNSNLHLVHRRCNTDKKQKTVREHWEWRVASGFDEVLIGHKLGIMGEPAFGEFANSKP